MRAVLLEVLEDAQRGAWELVAYALIVYLVALGPEPEHAPTVGAAFILLAAWHVAHYVVGWGIVGLHAAVDRWLEGRAAA